MPDLPMNLIERLPLSIVVFLLSSGAVMLFLTPIRFILPNWILESLLHGPSIDAISSLVIVIGIILIVGIPAFFLKDPICGNDGFNHWLKMNTLSRNKRKQAQKWKRIQKSSFISPSFGFKKEELADFIQWLKLTDQTSSLEFFNLENNLLGSFIIASEIGLVLNLGFVILFYSSVGSFLNSLLLADMLNFPNSPFLLFALLFWSVMLFLGSLFIDKKFVRNRRNARFVEIGEHFRAYQKQKTKKTQTTKQVGNSVSNSERQIATRKPKEQE